MRIGPEIRIGKEFILDLTTHPQLTTWRFSYAGKH
jgi:hypothetical protein